MELFCGIFLPDRSCKPNNRYLYMTNTNSEDMKELKCPHCGSVFAVDEADYASIVNQVKTPNSTRKLNDASKSWKLSAKRNRSWPKPEHERSSMI